MAVNIRDTDYCHHVTLQTGYDATQSQHIGKNLKIQGLFRDLAFLQNALKLEINTCCKTNYFKIHLFIMKGKKLS